MQEKVFIAWSGNYGYALETYKKLKAQGYNAIVGGNVSETTEQIFVGETIISQMRQCSQAIILIQKKKETNSISSNLMLEFGYLLKKLSYNKIHVFFIDIRENDIKIPSDIRGIWADFLQSDDKDIDVSQSIIKEFINRQYQIIKEDKINIFIDWYYYKNIIKCFATEPQCTSFELAQYLLFYMQAVYFNKDYDETNNIINKLLETNHLFNIELQSSLKFCKITLQFYNVFYSKTNNYLTKEQMLSIMYEYEDLNERITELKETEFKCWFYANIYEHLGFLIYYYLLTSTDEESENLKFYNQVIEYNKLALKYLSKLTNNGEFTSKNNLFFATLYKAYVYRQKAISHNYINKICDLEEQSKKSKESFIKAFEMRKILHNNFSDLKLNSSVLENMELDYYLSMSEVINFDEFASQKLRYTNELKNYLNKQQNKCDVISQHVRVIEKNLKKGEL